MIPSLSEDDYAELATGGIFAAIIHLEGSENEFDFDNLNAGLEAELERALLPALFMSDLSWTGGDDFDTLFKRATAALSSIRLRRFERMLDSLQIEMGQAEREQDAERYQLLFQRKLELKNRMLGLSAM
jgi:hypothetical protein